MRTQHNDLGNAYRIGGRDTLSGVLHTSSDPNLALHSMVGNVVGKSALGEFTQ